MSLDFDGQSSLPRRRRQLPVRAAPERSAGLRICPHDRGSTDGRRLQLSAARRVRRGTRAPSASRLPSRPGSTPVDTVSRGHRTELGPGKRCSCTRRRMEGLRFRASSSQAASLDRQWLVRALLVLQTPRPVFAALRDDTDESAHARRSRARADLARRHRRRPGGVGCAHAPRRLGSDGLVVAVWAFIAGGFQGALVFWLGGALVYGAALALGGQGSYRRARHLVAFACAPLALSLLVLWPIGLAAFGGDLFRWAAPTRDVAATSSSGRSSRSASGRSAGSWSAPVPYTGDVGARARNGHDRVGSGCPTGARVRDPLAPPRTPPVRRRGSNTCAAPRERHPTGRRSRTPSARPGSRRRGWRSA